MFAHLLNKRRLFSLPNETLTALFHLAVVAVFAFKIPKERYRVSAILEHSAKTVVNQVLQIRKLPTQHGGNPLSLSDRGLLVFRHSAVLRLFYRRLQPDRRLVFSLQEILTAHAVSPTQSCLCPSHDHVVHSQPELLFFKYLFKCQIHIGFQCSIPLSKDGRLRMLYILNLSIDFRRRP